MKQNFQQKMATLTQEFQQRFIKEQSEEWNKHVVNTDIPHKYRSFAFAFQTHIALSVRLDYFLWLQQQEIPEFKLGDAVMFCNSCYRALADWVRWFGRNENTTKEYAEYLAFCDSLTEEVNGACEPIADTLIRKMQSLQGLQVKAGSRQIPMA